VRQADLDLDVDLASISAGIVNGDCKFVDLRSSWKKDMPSTKIPPKATDYASQLRFFSSLAQTCAKRVPRKDLEMREIFTLNTHVFAR
jgi:hypothetical protein